MTTKSDLYKTPLKQPQNVAGSSVFCHSTFTGKELDSETGFSYFGARYLDHTLLISWFTVDPMSDKYPSISPYAYCAWNPVKLVDPDGKEKIISLFLDCIRNTRIKNAAERYYRNDPVIHLWAHGNKSSIEYDNNGKLDYISSASQMESFLREHSTVFNQNEREGKTSILVLHSCNTGEGEDNIAKKISAEANLLVVAPSELLKIQTTNPGLPYEQSYDDGTYVGTVKFVDNKIERNIEKKGYWKIYYKGVLVDSFSGTKKPVFRNPDEVIAKYEKKYREYVEKQEI